MNTYYILSPGNYHVISDYMLRDLKKIKGVRYLYLRNTKVKIKNAIISQFYDKLTMKKHIDLLVRKIIDEKKENKVVVFTNESLVYLEKDYVVKLKEQGIRLVMVLIDPMSATYDSVTKAKDVMEAVEFDQVYTFNPLDSEKYGYAYCNALYSDIVPADKRDTQFDFCYVGNVKNRLPLFKQIIEMFKKHEVKAFMKLSCFRPGIAKQIPKQYVGFMKVMDYEDVLTAVKESNCIFDITQEGQSGVTLRYYEAVKYNKKLLTNNVNIKKLPFYDERYIKFYETVEDIDWEWVKRRDEIDYGYADEYSPVNLLKRIEAGLK